MVKDTVPFKLFANCIPVKGANRSTVCDLQRNQFHLIPNSLYDLLKKYEGKTLMVVKADCGPEHHEIIESYFEFLEKEEIIFYTHTPDLFPALNLQWYNQAQIINCIIDFNADISYDFDKLISELDALDCKNLELRFYSRQGVETYSKILNTTAYATLTSISMLMPYDELNTADILDRLCDKYKRVTRLTIYNSPEEKEVLSFSSGVPVSFIKMNITGSKCCGNISADYFVSYTETFTESLAHNTCLNRKISIDIDGNIRNCPSMKESFGNIRDTTLTEALNKPGFKKYWNITKDHISVCKDCEFRHVCTDCRAYIEDPEDDYSKPLKCGYNPYTCEWEEWSTLPMKQQAMEYYGMQELFRKI